MKPTERQSPAKTPQPPQEPSKENLEVDVDVDELSYFADEEEEKDEPLTSCDDPDFEKIEEERTRKGK